MTNFFKLLCCAIFYFYIAERLWLYDNCFLANMIYFTPGAGGTVWKVILNNTRWENKLIDSNRKPLSTIWLGNWVIRYLKNDMLHSWLRRNGQTYIYIYTLITHFIWIYHVHPKIHVKLIYNCSTIFSLQILIFFI